VLVDGQNKFISMLEPSGYQLKTQGTLHASSLTFSWPHLIFFIGSLFLCLGNLGLCDLKTWVQSRAVFVLCTCLLPMSLTWECLHSSSSYTP
jgi:cell division protein FtsW (lipid II flippase)